MKKLTKSLFAVALASSFLLGACANEEEPKDDTQQEENTETGTEETEKAE